MACERHWRQRHFVVCRSKGALTMKKAAIVAVAEPARDRETPLPLSYSPMQSLGVF
jgi:hypothetical protein